MGIFRARRPARARNRPRRSPHPATGIAEPLEQRLLLASRGSDAAPPANRAPTLSAVDIPGLLQFVKTDWGFSYPDSTLESVLQAAHSNIEFTDWVELIRSGRYVYDRIGAGNYGAATQ